MIRVDALVNPWAAFIGLIELHRSPYCERGISYALDPSRTGYAELGQRFIMHPDDVEPARRSVAKSLGHVPNDAELAAFLHWYAMQSRAK